MKNRVARFLVVAAAVAFTLVWNGDIAPRSVSVSGFMTAAEAIIGRPATPVSYAGVARRTTRRAVVY